MEQKIILLEQKIAQLEHQIDQLASANTQKDMEMHRLNLQIQGLAQSMDTLKGMIQQGAGEDSNPPPPHY